MSILSYIMVSAIVLLFFYARRWLYRILYAESYKPALVDQRADSLVFGAILIVLNPFLMAWLFDEVPVDATVMALAYMIVLVALFSLIVSHILAERRLILWNGKAY